MKPGAGLGGDTYVITNTADSELLPAAADLDEYGNGRRLFIYILICIYEAISLMLSLVTGLWVKVLSLELSLVYTNRPSQQLQSHNHGFSSCILAPRCCKE